MKTLINGLSFDEIKSQDGKYQSICYRLGTPMGVLDVEKGKAFWGKDMGFKVVADLSWGTHRFRKIE